MTTSHENQELCFWLLNRKKNRVRKEMEAYDEPAKKLEQNPFPKILKLNVGGHIFLTSLASWMYANNCSGTVGCLIPDTLIRITSLSPNSAQ